ncbi:hypothetical protein [Bacteroides ihuae]|uniref:hypothetical protein n=1 Tax=Bacteroides ihuae TaxID=1852362 RepID=UPI0008DA9171|nr:hypothetical protein [Bacteroides ihuae]
MKIIQAILIFSLSLILFSCGDDDNIDFNAASLEQTQWSGTLKETDAWGNGEYTANIGMIFYSEDKGRCSVKRGDDSPFEYDFDYSIDGKILVLNEKKGDLDGYWLLIQSNKDKMVLEKGTGGDGAYKGTLTLKKTD